MKRTEVRGMALFAYQCLSIQPDSAGWCYCFSNCSTTFRRTTRLKPVTIFPMVLATFAIRLLEGMFFVGLAGSAVVVLISFVEDFKELFGDE
jgi:hypothetical protein